MQLKNLETLIEIAKSKPQKKLVVAAAEDDNVLMAVFNARREGLIEPILIGNLEKISKITNQLNITLDGVRLIEENNPALSAKKAVQIIKSKEAQVLMKGLVSTADFLRAILDKENGLRKGELLSHIGFFEVPAYHKVIALTDAAQNVAPTLDDKTAILKNAIELFHHIGIFTPKIAILAAVEVVNPKMEATVHASMLTQMYHRGQIKGCIIDGPLAFDNAVSTEACLHKGIVSEVGGDADLLLAPDIEAGNMLYKSFTYFGQGSVAAIILGASVPIVLTSRADSDKSKLMSIALAASF